MIESWEKKDEEEFLKLTVELRLKLKSVVRFRRRVALPRPHDCSNPPIQWCARSPVPPSVTFDLSPSYNYLFLNVPFSSGTSITDNTFDLSEMFSSSSPLTSTLAD